MKESDGVTLHRAIKLGREVLVLEGDDPERMADAFRGLTASLRKTLAIAAEPMPNSAAFLKGGRWSLLILPRR